MGHRFTYILVLGAIGLVAGAFAVCLLWGLDPLSLGYLERGYWFSIPFLTALLGGTLGSLIWRGRQLAQSSELLRSAGEEKGEEYRKNVALLTRELEEKSRLIAGMDQQRAELEKQLQERTAELQAQERQFNRIQSEMANQLEVRSEIEQELIDSQTRLELINALSAGLFSNSSFQRILYQATMKTEAVFPKIQVYFGSIDHSQKLTWVDFDPSNLPTPIDLNNHSAYLDTLQAEDVLDCRNIQISPHLPDSTSFFSRRALVSTLERIVMVDKQPAGILGFGTTSPHEWSSHQQQTLTELTRFLSVASKTIDLENERTKAVRKLLDAKKTAEDATRAKSVFLSTLSHEIRTPLNGVLGMTQLILNTKLTEEQAEYARIAHSSGGILLALLNDILDFSKIEAGKLELESARFNLREVLEQTCEVLAFQAQSKELELICHLPYDLPDTVVGDRTRLRQVIMNLVSNAIKFTEKGHVLLKAGFTIEQPNRLRLDVQVSDTGIGIPEESMGRLFKSFSQADSSTTRKFGGTGLGLVISKQLVELMDGTIAVESQPGQGACFSFHVLLDQPLTTHSTAANIGKCVLISTDNPALSESLSQLVLKQGLTPVILHNGSNKSLLDEAASRPDLLFALIDETLWARQSDSDRLKLTSRQSKLPNRILVPFHMEGAGDEPLLKKPVSWAQFRTIFEKPEDRETTQDSIEPIREHAHVKILLVDDQPINRKLCGTFLKKAGYSYVEAENGQRALEALDQEPFDLILMDCRMPVMDGFEATKRIRQLASTLRDIPIVALTANVSQSERELCMESGMDEFLTKPLNMERLFEVIENLTEGLTNPQVTANRDLSLIEEAAGGDHAFFLELLEMFGADIHEMFEASCQAYAKEDWHLLGEHAHGIKGAAANAGFDDLRSAALALETACTELKFEGIPPCFEKLRATVHLVQADLAGLSNKS